LSQVLKDVKNERSFSRAIENGLLWFRVSARVKVRFLLSLSTSKRIIFSLDMRTYSYLEIGFWRWVITTERTTRLRLHDWSISTGIRSCVL
jgi:hypothetical protein